MKAFKKCLILFLGLTFIVGQAHAQEKKASQIFVIHEDKVHPSMVGEYEQAAKNLAENLKKYNVQDADYTAFSTTDFRYMYVSPIDKMADLDKDAFKVLDEKMGKEAMAKMWADFDKCYDQHGDYIMYLDDELSYQPSETDISSPNQPYRNWDVWRVNPENSEKLAEVAKAFKELHISSETNFYYRVYRSGFGTMGPYYMVSTSAKDKTDFINKQKAATKLMGEERGKLVQQALKLCSGYETMEGWARPGLSYQAKAMTAAVKEEGAKE